MARNQQTFETIVTLNAQSAQDELKKMKQNLDDLKKKKQDLLDTKNYNPSDLRNINKEIRQSQSELKAYNSKVKETIDVLHDLDHASLGELRAAVRSLKGEMKNVTDESEYKQLDGLLQNANKRILELKSSAGETAEETQRLGDASKVLANVLANLNTSTMDELRRAAAAAQENLYKLKPDTDAYKSQAADLEKIRKRITEVQLAQTSANQTIDKYDQEIAEATRSAADLSRENQLIDRTLKNISGASYRDIEYSLKLVREQLRGMSHDDAAFNVLAKKAKQLDNELKKVRSEMDVTSVKKSFFVKTADFLNKNWGAMTQFTASLTGVTMTIRKCVSEFASMDEAMTNVMKYTGQTKEEVKSMNEDFKKIDTRTSREDLNALAGAAGRLGITSKQSIEEFVDAADKIGVALGDDLGEGAVDQIGKLAMAFGEDDKMGLRGAMLATGSALNELAQNSSSKAGYLVDFTARVAGVGKQLGLTQAQIMGFGAVMDENMQKDEMASTAFSQLLTKMATDTSKFAKMAGKSTSEFAKMMKTDVNGAVIALMENLHKSGGFSELAQIFNEMQLDGTRCVQVLSTMADKVEDIKTRQQVASQAYAQGTSVLNEFNNANSSAQAELDKAKKKFKELTIELGEKVMPIARYGITTTSLLVKGLSLLTDFVNKYKGTLVRLAATITIINVLMNLYNIRIKIHNIYIATAEKTDKAYTKTMMATRSAIVALHAIWALLTKGVKGYIAVMRAAKLESLTNPWTALATVLLTVGVAIYEVISKLKGEKEEAEKAAMATNKFVQIQRNTKEVNEEANKSIAEEVTKFNSLRKTLEDSNAKYEDRQKALYQIKQMVPSYHGTLTKEGQLINSNVAVLQQYIDNLVKAARAQAAFNKMVQIQESSLNHENLKNKRVANQQYYLNKMKSEFNFDPRKDTLGYLVGSGAYVLDENNNRVGGYYNADQTKKLNTYLKMYNWNQKRIDQENKILDCNKAQTDELNKQVQANGTILSNNNNNVIRNTDTKTTSTYHPGDAKASEKAEKERKKQEHKREKKFKEEVKAQKSHTAELQAQLILQYSTGNKLYSDYMNERHQTTIDGLKKIKDLYVKYGKDIGEIEEKIAEEKKSKQEDNVRNTINEMEKGKNKKETTAKLQYYSDPSSDLFQNEEALNERLFQIDYDAQKKKVNMLTKGTEEWFDAKDELEQMEQGHSLAQQQKYQEKLSQFMEKYGRHNVEAQRQFAMDGLEWMEQYELSSVEDTGNEKEAKTEEQEKAITEIKKKYAKMRAQIQRDYDLQQSEEDLYNSKGEEFKRDVNTTYQTASNKAKAEYENKHPYGGGLMDYLTSDISIFKSTIDNIKSQEAEFAKFHKDLVNDGLETQQDADEAMKKKHKESTAAMSQASADMAEKISAKMQVAYEAVSGIMSSMSSYYSAQQDYEIAVTDKKYDKLIERAGNNSAKQKKLEEKKQKEEAKIKNKYNKKQMKIELAQAFASTAMAAINSYASAAKEHWLLGAIAAAMATAAGMAQIATIKKQHQAEEAGYYEGGFTGGSSYRKEAGVVHQGEFVANHQAVSNQQLLPALQLIDMAQRNNTVGTLTAMDVSRSLGTGGATVVSAPSVTVNNDNGELTETLRQAQDTISRLGALLEDGIHANVSIDGPSGIDHQYRRFKQLQANK